MTRVNVGGGGAEANGGSYTPTLSADGRNVAFESKDPNLVAGVADELSDIFVHDRETGATTKVSAGADAAEANS